MNIPIDISEAKALLKGRPGELQKWALSLVQRARYRMRQTVQGVRKAELSVLPEREPGTEQQANWCHGYRRRTLSPAGLATRDVGRVLECHFADRFDLKEISCMVAGAGSESDAWRERDLGGTVYRFVFCDGANLKVRRGNVVERIPFLAWWERVRKMSV